MYDTNRDDRVDRPQFEKAVEALLMYVTTSLPSLMSLFDWLNAYFYK